MQMGTKIHFMSKPVQSVCLESAVQLDRVLERPAEAIQAGVVRLWWGSPTTPKSMALALLKAGQAGQSVPGSGHY